MPFGVQLVGLVGLILIGVALSQLWRALFGDVRRDWHLGGLGENGAWAVRIGRFGRDPDAGPALDAERTAQRREHPDERAARPRSRLGRVCSIVPAHEPAKRRIVGRGLDRGDQAARSAHPHGLRLRRRFARDTPKRQALLQKRRNPQIGKHAITYPRRGTHTDSYKRGARVRIASEIARSR